MGLYYFNKNTMKITKNTAIKLNSIVIDHAFPKHENVSDLMFSAGEELLITLSDCQNVMLNIRSTNKMSIWSIEYSYEFITLFILESNKFLIIIRQFFSFVFGNHKDKIHDAFYLITLVYQLYYINQGFPHPFLIGRVNTYLYKDICFFFSHFVMSVYFVHTLLSI